MKLTWMGHNRALPIWHRCRHLLLLFPQGPNCLSLSHLRVTRIFKLTVFGYLGVFICQVIPLELSGPNGFMHTIWLKALPYCRMLLVMLISLCAFLRFSMACHSNVRCTTWPRNSGQNSLLISRRRRIHSLVLPLDSGLRGERINLGGIRAVRFV